MLRSRLMLLAASAIFISLNYSPIRSLPSSAQGVQAIPVSPGSSQTVVAHPSLYKELTKPEDAYHPITMPDGDYMGANIPGAMIVGALKPTPTALRIGFGIFYGMLLLMTGVWALLGYREMCRILGKEFG